MKEKDKGDGQSTIPFSSIALPVRYVAACSRYEECLRMPLPQTCQTKKLPYCLAVSQIVSIFASII